MSRGCPLTTPTNVMVKSVQAEKQPRYGWGWREQMYDYGGIGADITQNRPSDSCMSASSSIQNIIGSRTAVRRRHHRVLAEHAEYHREGVRSVQKMRPSRKTHFQNQTRPFIYCCKSIKSKTTPPDGSDEIGYALRLRPCFRSR
jgi:hypothetical protein